MQNIKISVIMPVYNVEKYVGKAIESVQAQTLKEFEFLIVDDGTPDNSGRICDAYALSDDRIRVFHRENGGAPSARNMAMEHARGKYYYFMDSDDWVEPTMLEDMYELAEKNNTQLVVTGYFIDTYYNDTDYIRINLKQPDAVYDQQAFRENAYKLFDCNLLYTPWNKLYSREYVDSKGLRFPSTFWDDFPFVLSVIRDIERVAVSSKQYYHFIRARADSETAAYRSNMYEKREEEHGWMIELYEYWQISDDASKEMIARRYVERLVGCIENVTNPNCKLSKAEKREKIKEMIFGKNARSCIKIARPRSLMMKLLLFPIKWKSVMLAMVESNVISMVKSSNTKLFATLKAKR
ncbi:MAG TPA: glycosyl transferase [Ruminococcaceae bacterium]|jgi:glycosyltransferase EpsJ|nr:glycosyl transferase [Oscillospiraceae bacterium]HCA29360.1 glycosyl transferase [Oscillospiraceae bacterium]